MAILNIRRVERSDLENCIALEKCCYPPLETATRELLEKRIEVYPDGFYVAEIENKIVGMVNCGATHQEDITEEAFKQLIGHVRNGKNGVVFSLAVYPDHRNKGIASLLIKEIVRVSKSKQKENILLLCKDNLVDFYRDLGFGYGGLSSSKYGGSTWHEMRYPLSLHA